MFRKFHTVGLIPFIYSLPGSMMCETETERKRLALAVVFEQVFILFVFVAAGFTLGKCKVVKAEHSKILSSILVYVVLPCNVFKTFSSKFTVAYITGNYPIVLTSTVLILVLSVAANLGARLFAKEKYERCIFEYSLLIPNYGYMGYALAEALLGEAGLVNFMTFALPASLYIYTVGFSKLTKRGLSLKKLCNPVIIATALGIAAGLSGISVPGAVSDILSKSSGCMAPVSMLLTGIVLSELPLKRIINNKKIYPLAAMRLVVIPLVVGFVLSRFCDSAVTQIAVLFLALPCGLNTVVFPKLVDENCEIGAGIALITTTLACITLPVVLSFFNLGL